MTLLQANLAIALLAAHVLADFVFQTERGVEEKKQVWVLGAHCLVVAILSYVLSGLWSAWPILVVVFFTHFGMDLIKRHHLSPTLHSFIIDHVVHLAVIGALTVTVPYMTESTSSAFWYDAVSVHFYRWLLGLAGFTVATYAGAVLVGLAVKPFQRQTECAAGLGGTRGSSDGRSSLLEGFPQGGKTIGFLIAAKSILRFGEVGRGAPRKDIEYIVMGTLMSLFVAVVVFYLTRLGFCGYGSVWPAG